MPRIEQHELTPTLLRRIARAIDGYRAGHDLYVAVDVHPPYRVERMFAVMPGSTAAAVEERAEDACVKADAKYQGRIHKWAGPFQTYKEEDPPFIVECHEFDSDPCEDAEITGATMNYPGSPLPKPTDVKEITISWKTRDASVPDGRKIFRWPECATDAELLLDYEDDELEGVKQDLVDHMVDALFLTQAASDKFLIPYIARVHGANSAYEHRARMRVAVKKAWAKWNKQTGHIPTRLRKVNKLDRVAGRSALVDKDGKIVWRDHLDDWNRGVSPGV